MSKEPCVIGFASDRWSTESGTWYDTHIGGVAIWPEQLDVVVPTCPRCSAQRVLVLQAYAPHHKHLERALYIFGCNSITCSAEAPTWWTVRVCKVDEVPSVKGSQPGISGERQQETTVQATPLVKEQVAINWDTDSEAADDASSESGLADDLALLSLQVQLATAEKEAAALTDQKDQSNQSSSRTFAKPSKRERHASNDGQRTPEKVISTSDPDPSAMRQPFVAYYVQVDYEPPASKPLAEEYSVDSLLQKYMQEEHSRVASGTTEPWAAEKEDEESSARRHCENFLETTARAPGQILRYKFGGEPLWPKYPFPEVDVDTCCECGSQTVFELQVLGSCLHYLQPEKSVPDHQNEAGMNFSSIAVFTCAADCTTVDAIADNGVFKVISQTVCVQLDDW